jgi:hypothetical protein
MPETINDNQPHQYGKNEFISRARPTTEWMKNNHNVTGNEKGYYGK